MESGFATLATPARNEPHRLLPFTRAFAWLLRIGFALIPSAAILYLEACGDHARRFIDYGFHEGAIAVAVTLSGFVSYVTWLCYRHSGEPFLRWVALGMTGFTLVYLPHGLLTRAADCNLWLFLLYGPASRIVMVACLFIGLLRYGAAPDSETMRRSFRPIALGIAAFAAIDVLVAAAANSPTVFGPGLRIAAEYGSILLVAVCMAIVLVRRIASPLMRLYQVSMIFFAQSCLSFILAKPWDHQWWLAHAIFAGGFFVLSYGLLQAFHTTRSFSTAYSQEEMMRRLEQANAELHRLAATDSLTGAANRRHFLARFEEELRRAQRGGAPLALLMMDLDYFKSVNDEHGHQAGDAVLVAFVQRAREVLRLPDLVGRLGGEEFAVLLPGSDAAQAAGVAERIRAAMEQPVELPHGSALVTTSIGIAQAGADGSCIEQIIKTCDERLYRAKAAGRNCVVG
jgi:diguanylate cyclase (GGDEF)-like protein